MLRVIKQNIDKKKLFNLTYAKSMDVENVYKE